MMRYICNATKGKDKKERKKEKGILTLATISASTTGMSWDLKRLETVLFPDEIPPVNPTILISTHSIFVLSLIFLSLCLHR
jgi:hypothetical protein